MSHHPIPEAALKKHIAILGMNGSGKTSVAKSQIIEPALGAGERICNIDPTGVGWGLRLSATGKSKGFPVYIVGGDHADFPLFRRDGKAWAEIVGTSSDSFVFDTSAMTVEDRSQWFTDFAETLIRKNKGPLKLVLDEAHLFAPQGGSKSGGVAPRMLHATNNLLALGRSRGLRITMISQRPAKLHKDSLTQAHTLIAMALMAPQDRAAVKDWIADQADVERGKEIIASLPSMAPGEGWIWAPKEKVLDRVKFSRPKTFDSSSAPDDADAAAVELSPVNPEAIKAKLATVAKETVANDPAALKAALAARDREVAALKQAVTATPVADPKMIEAAERNAYVRAEAETAPIWFRRGVEAAVEGIQGHAAAFNVSAFITKELATWKGIGAIPVAPPAPQPKPKPVAIRQPTLNGGTHAASTKLPKGERACLIATAQHPNGVSRQQLTVLTGYKRSSRDAYLQRLRERDYIEISSDRITPTQEGIAALGSDYEPLPTGDALRSHVLSTLPEGERRVLEVVIASYPNEIQRLEIDAATNYQRSSRDAYLQRLSARELVSTIGRGAVKANDNLFG